MLHCSRFFYLDNSNGAAVASRAVMECLLRRGFGVEVLCGSIVDSGERTDPADLLIGLGFTCEADGGGEPASRGGRSRSRLPHHLRSLAAGVPVIVHRRPSRGYDLPDAREATEFLALLEDEFDRFRPDVLVTYGGDSVTLEMMARARARGVATVFALHNFAYQSPKPFAEADAILVPSLFAANYYRAAVGLECTVIPNLIDLARVRPEFRNPRYVTFVNPSGEKGVFPFARIADELGRLRPDIPLLVVESRGSEGTLVACGLDLRRHGNVFLMAQTRDPRDFWRETRLCLMPSLWWENQPLVALEAMVNGIPVVGSDRGGIPEVLGAAGVILPLPDRLTPLTNMLPDAEEVRPWVEEVIRLWDDRTAYDEQSRLALVEAERWRPEVIEPRYISFFSGLKSGASSTGHGSEARSDWVVLVPTTRGIAPECEGSLRILEAVGIRVVRDLECRSHDVALGRLLSDALRDGSRSLLLIDGDVAFDPFAAMKCLARPEAVITAACLVGQPAGHYPVDKIGAGFLRVRAEVLERMVESLVMPLIRDSSGREFRHFFQESTRLGIDGARYHLGPEEAFVARLWQVGATPLGDTSIAVARLRGIGDGSPGAAYAWGIVASSWDRVPGFFDFHRVYADAVRQAKDEAVFVEIGTLVGRSTCYFAQEILLSGKAISFYAVDTCRGSPTDSTGREIAPAMGGSYAGELHRNILSCGLGGVVVPIVTESKRAAKLFPPGGVDFCFIDGDHSYASVMDDLAAWWPKIKPGGSLAGHDYRQTAPWLIDVTRAVHDFFGVREATHPLAATCWVMKKTSGPD